MRSKVFGQVFAHDHLLGIRGAELKDFFQVALPSAPRYNSLTPSYQHTRNAMSTEAKSHRHWAWQDAIYGAMFIGSLIGLVYIFRHQ